MDDEVMRLYSTGEARVWAEHFVEGVKELYGIELDLEWVWSWFANAMEVVRDIERKRRGEV
jgi:hypothetical protein